ncbi:MAG TPA: endonuclease [Gammaproteobacteria bacterium]
MRLRQLYDRLYKAYGPQHWWPADSPFEVMVGAVLTQNTAWSNVEKAITNLKAHHHLDAAAIAKATHTQLAHWLKPSGYFNIKAKRLQNFCRWYLAQGGYDKLNLLDTLALRKALLGVNGIGPETADDIVLYAFHRQVFVIDAYTRRLLTRLGLSEGDESYEELRAICEKGLARMDDKVAVFNEFHALIVMHAKMACRKKPLCALCTIAHHCPRIGVGA